MGATLLPNSLPWKRALGNIIIIPYAQLQEKQGNGVRWAAPFPDEKAAREYKKYSLQTPERGNEMLLAPPDRKARSGIKLPGYVYWDEWMGYVVEE